MMMSVLPSDNLQLSRPKNWRIAGGNCPIGALAPLVADFVDASVSESSRRAYRSDLTHFIDWGGAIPSDDATVASYLAGNAERLAIATLVRRLASISKAHAIAGLQSPTGSPLVQATLRGIRRRNGSAQRQAKPLLRDDLFAVLSAMGDTPKDIRDGALLLIGFAGGFRRSELVGLDAEDIETVRQGLVITLRRSKTDQRGEGRKIGIPFGRTQWCPVSALSEWLTFSVSVTGPVFRSINRHGKIEPHRLSGEAVAIVLRQRLSAAGYDPRRYSGHSLRAGFATSAAEAGAPAWKIREQTGHASDAMLTRYIRSGELFAHNAAGCIL